MRLISAKELVPFIHNALETYVDGEGFLRFSRFTKKQAARYRYDSVRISQNDLFAITFASSNVTVEMDTDSSVFGMNFRWQDKVKHNFLSFDLMVDGCLYQHFYTTKEKCKLFSFPLPGDEKTHRVQLFFPWGDEIRLESIVLSEGAKAEPVPDKKLRILAYGDSITQGYIGLHPAMNYAAHMTRKLDAECLNQAIGGYYYEEESLDEALAAWKPDLITVAYGTNDYALRTTSEEVAMHAEAFYKRLREIFPKTPVLALMPVYRNDERHHMRELMRPDSFEYMKELLRGVYARVPGLTVLEDTYFPRHADFLAEDEVHPNDLGFAYYGEAVVNAIKNMQLQ